MIKFTSDDKLYFRYDKKAIEIYDTTHKRIGLIELGQVKMFTISKIATEKDFLLVVFFLDVLNLYNLEQNKARQNTDVHTRVTD